MKSMMILISTLLLSTSVWASKKSYQMNMEVSVNGELVSSARLVTNEGERKVITQKMSDTKNQVEVIAKEGEIGGNKGILMAFKIFEMKKDGSKKMISTPMILSKSGKEAIAISESANQKVSVKVTATRRTL